MPTRRGVCLVGFPTLLADSKHFLVFPQELLFCETCDTVFCTLCTGGNHSPPDDPENRAGLVAQLKDGGDGNGNSNSGSPTKGGTGSSTVDHTVIPFSIAIKRMSEILIYKANECRAKVSLAV